MENQQGNLFTLTNPYAHKEANRFKVKAVEFEHISKLIVAVSPVIMYKKDVVVDEDVMKAWVFEPIRITFLSVIAPSVEQALWNIAQNINKSGTINMVIEELDPVDYVIQKWTITASLQSVNFGELNATASSDNKKYIDAYFEPSMVCLEY